MTLMRFLCRASASTSHNYLLQQSYFKRHNKLKVNALIPRVAISVEVECLVEQIWSVDLNNTETTVVLAS